MTSLKQNIIHWILAKQYNNLTQAADYLHEIDPQLKAYTHADYLRHFSHWIRHGSAMGYRDVNPSPAGVSKPPEPAHQPVPEVSENIDLSTEARINLDIDRLMKARNALHNRLHQCTSTQQRKSVLDEATEVQAAISYNKSLLRQLKQGNKVDYTNTYFSKPDENDFEVPTEILELDRKHRYMMSIRSKRKAKMQDAMSKYGTNTLQHQQAIAEWKHFDEVVNHLKSKIDEKLKNK